MATIHIDLPASLNTDPKRRKWAKKLVAEHLGSPAKRVALPPIQGMFSSTLFLTLADSREVVVQFRTEKLDLGPFRTASASLGSLVPDAQPLADDELEAQGVWAYCFARVPGLPWFRAACGNGARARLAVTKSLGRIFSQGCLAEESREAVEKTVRPHLEAVLELPLDKIQPFKATLEGYLGKLDKFARLPLWIAHFDLNDVNIIVDEETFDITGLVDWELSTPQPFGMGFGRIHSIAGEYHRGEFCMPDEFEEAERSFWKELFRGMPDKARTELEGNLELVQDAVLLGTLLGCFFIEDGKVGYSQVALKAMPKFLTYRLPMIRGDAAPYSM